MEIKMKNNVENKENSKGLGMSIDEKKVGSNKTAKKTGPLENVMNLNGGATPIKVKPKNKKNSGNTGLVENIENENYS